MKTYYVKFAYYDEAEPQVRKFQATSPGHAFQQCLREFPGARLFEGWCEGWIGRVTRGGITYEPLSAVRVVAESAPVAEETKFPFYDDCISRPPSMVNAHERFCG